MTGRLLPPSALREVFDRPHRRIFRLETLQSYAAPDETAMIEAFRAGRSRPADPGKDEWTAVVRAGRRAGTRFQRVHVCREPLSDYLQYELTWSYEPSVAAGEDVRIVALPAAAPWPAELPEFDFWLFDDDELMVMHYDRDGSWRRVERRCTPTDLCRARAWRAAALRQAQPWQAFVAGRPDLASRLCRTP